MTCGGILGTAEAPAQAAVLLAFELLSLLNLVSVKVEVDGATTIPAAGPSVTDESMAERFAARASSWSRVASRRCPSAGGTGEELGSRFREPLEVP
jgi:hypothetical protein